MLMHRPTTSSDARNTTAFYRGVGFNNLRICAEDLATCQCCHCTIRPDSFLCKKSFTWCARADATLTSSTNSSTVSIYGKACYHPSNANGACFSAATTRQVVCPSSFASATLAQCPLRCSEENPEKRRRFQSARGQRGMPWRSVVPISIHEHEQA